MRIFNTYGPRMALDDGRVVSNFVAQALTDQPITVYGDGQQVRVCQDCAGRSMHAQSCEQRGVWKVYYLKLLPQGIAGIAVLRKGCPRHQEMLESRQGHWAGWQLPMLR